MPNAYAPILIVTVISLGILAFSLAFAYRDTVRGFREIFDYRVVQSFIRSALRHRLRYSLATLLIVATLTPPLAWIAFDIEWSEFMASPAAIAYVTLVILPLAYFFVVETFGPGPRERWKDLVERNRSRFNESSFNQEGASTKKTTEQHD